MNIKDLRIQTGLSQTEFGKRLGGIPIRTIQDWEAGRRQPPLYIVDAETMQKKIKVTQYQT